MPKMVNRHKGQKVVRRYGTKVIGRTDQIIGLKGRGYHTIDEDTKVSDIDKSNIEEIKKYITDAYRKILLRDPDIGGLADYTQKIYTGTITKEELLDILRTSEEYRIRFEKKLPQDTINKNQTDNDTSKITTEEDAIIKIIEPKKGSKIAIASIVRNEEHNGNLRRFLDCCKELEQYHNNIVYIFIEGDSSDKTYNVLESWVENRNGSVLEKINKGHPPFPKTRDTKRTKHFANLRNRLVDIILSRTDINEILMIDANYGWSGDLISSLRETDADIAAPLVVSHKDRNGKSIFYDIWVFRKNGREFGPFYPYVKGMTFDKPTGIDSVGGGYLIKRYVLDTNVRYNGDNDSEHVGFCRHAKSLGFSIKINPFAYIRKGGFRDCPSCKHVR